MRKPRKSKRTDPIKTLHDEPIIIPHSPAHLEEDSPPSPSRWPLVFLIIGSLAILFCIWKFTPEWLAAMLKNFMWQFIDG